MSRAVIGSLRVNLGIDSAQFQQGLAGAQSSLKAFGDKATALGTKLSTRVTAPMAAIGAAGLALATKVASAGNAIAKSADEAGLAAQSYQELGFAIGQISQLSEEQARQGLADLNARIGQAIQGNDQLAEKIEGLGVSMASLRDGSAGTEEVFEALIVKLGQTGSAAEAAAIASGLMGEEVGRRLGPALRENAGNVDALRARYRELGLAMSDDALAASEEFTDRMDELKRQFAALGIQVGAALLPALNALIPVFQERIIPALVTVAEKVAGVIEWFAGLPGPVQEAAALFAAAVGVGGPILLAIGAASKAIGALIATTGPIGLLIAAVGAVVLAWRNWDQITEFVAGVYTGAKEWLQDKLGAILDWVVGKVTAVKDAFFKLYDDVVGNSYVPDMVDGIKAEFERLPEVMVAPAEAATAQVGAGFRRLEEDSAAVGDVWDRFAAPAESTLNALIDGTFSWRDALKEALGVIKDIARQQLSGGSGGGGGLLGGLLGSVVGGIAGSFSSTGFGFFDSVATSPFATGANVGIIRSARGNVFDGGRLVKFASGGIVSGPTTFPMADGRTGLMGEAGPEAIMPLERGPDGRLGVRGGGAARVTVNIQTQDARSFVKSEGQISAAIARAVRQGQGLL